MDILDFAIEFENRSRGYYQRMAGHAQLEELRHLFNALAADEENHVRILESLKNHSPVTFESNHLGESEEAFSKIVSEPFGPADFSRLKVLNEAMKFEEDSMAFYREQADSAEKVSERLMFLRLYFEEKKHREMVDDLIEFNTFIETSLETAEFQK